ncbi:putative membrane spanning protein [Granulibacter bethesdensis]|uniref:Membrane spanning protein n=2 Tax=Granulibacter bethesdensis TaxID=364410 RepID=Q0BV53_GRABC|nr:putative membrane spanning protein [Granulibacter bethesdensis CGDNIH1]AHJ67413.1 putative membrane spanning protein [Granulibacter bethesdensis]APH51086.1 putative membrane spanning protein [Granulibacter bethesdensis]APH63780.1 putative membrane spanning protein [Granulibacter bethesdensis]
MASPADYPPMNDDQLSIAGQASVLQPLQRAITQLEDAPFRAVVMRSLGWALLLLCLLVWLGFKGAGWLPVHWWQGDHWGGWDWLAGIVGAMAIAALGLWLFVPISAAIGGLFADTVAICVERRWYPEWQPATPAPLQMQIWDGLALGLRVLVVSLITLPVVLLLPGAGFVLGWLVSAWALGQGLFVSVAMRRMSRADARRLYRTWRGTILVQGGILAAIGMIPAVNLLLPALGPAVMVHVLARIMMHRRAF